MQTHELFLSHGHTDTDNMAFQLSISASVRECARWVWHILIAAAYVRIQFENRFTRVPTHTFVCCFLASPQFTIHVQCDSQRQYSLCSIYFFVRNFSFPLAGTLLACSLSFVWMKLRQILFFRTYTHTHTHMHTLFSVYICVMIIEFWCVNSDFIAQSSKKALLFELNVKIKLCNFGNVVNAKQPPVLTEMLQIKHQLRNSDNRKSMCDSIPFHCSWYTEH